MLICKFCSKECKNKNSHSNHQRLCKENPDRVYVNGMLGKKGANQFTKAKENGIEIFVSEETRKKQSAKAKGRKHTPESKAKLSAAAKKNNWRWSYVKEKYLF